ncbi:MAG: hypothetical protein EHM89_01635 [Acidobacteria bacterium]|nr:MAG: hypothetical protein EHM89_01635 [Acidobacteriota bacterium]
MFPLPAILACLLLDAVDQPLFQTYTSVDLAGYQAYDKALDVFYLSIAMFATLRNWTNYTAVQIARFFFYWRLVGVAAFEMTGWRVLLLVFPNTFEYFFIFYEIVRSRWSTRRLGARRLIVSAVLITAVLKLPQEYWIHVARLDFTDTFKTGVLDAPKHASWGYAIAQRPVVVAFVIALTVGLSWLSAHLVRRFMGPPGHALRLPADPLPARIDEAHERDRSIGQSWRLFDLHLLEKTVLVAFVTVIFARIVPGVHASPVQLVSSVTVIVTINAFLRIRSARAGESIESAALSFVALAVTNAAIVVVADRLLPQSDRGFTLVTTAFFLLLLTLIVTLYDRWRPVFDVRFRGRASS